MSDSEEVICGEHGNTPVTFACRHLASGVACGFHCSTENPDDRWPDAWCDACEEQPKLGAEVIKILCTHCWEAARARNERVPTLARGQRAALTKKEQQRLFTGATEQLQRVQDAANAKWKFMEHPRWDFDAEQRTLTFSDRGEPRVIADIRLVGSYSTKSDSFQWSWAMYGRDDPMIDGISDLPAFGEVRGIERMTTKHWKCDVVDGWEMTAIAALLLGCEGVYRAPFDDLYWFMLLSGFRAPN
jgi:hypothetical protein